MSIVDSFPVEMVSPGELIPHPRNYRIHPNEQLEHLVESLREHGIYRPIVTAQDGTILAGHGVVLAAKAMGMETVPIRRLPLSPDDPRALKLLAGDNEISNLGTVDDKALALILQTIQQEDEEGLLGTGYDDKALARLLDLAGVAGEEAETSPEEEWEGMPAFKQAESFGAIRTIKVHFATVHDLADFAKRLGQTLTLDTKSIWHPEKKDDDLKGYVAHEQS